MPEFFSILFRSLLPLLLVVSILGCLGALLLLPLGVGL